MLLAVNNRSCKKKPVSVLKLREIVKSAYLDVLVCELWVKGTIRPLRNSHRVRLIFTNCEEVQVDLLVVALAIFHWFDYVELAVVQVRQVVVVEDGADDVLAQLLDIVQVDRRVNLWRVESQRVRRQEELVYHVGKVGFIFGLRVHL